MTFCVTHTFTDWDGVVVQKGTLADELVAMGWTKLGGQLYNLISCGRVLAVTIRRPPVEEVRP